MSLPIANVYRDYARYGRNVWNYAMSDKPVKPIVNYLMPSRKPRRTQGMRRTRYGKRQVKGRYNKSKGLKKQVAQLSRIAKADQGTLIFRTRDTTSASSAVNSSLFKGVQDLNTLTKMELVLAQLRYYDPADPATLIVAPGATGSFQKDFFFDKSHHKIEIRNNYIVPVKVRFYIFKVKEDTNITPQVAFENGMADIGNPGNTSALVYPTDSNQLMELWKIAKSVSFTLEAGQSRVITYTNKKFVYDPSISDNHSLTFQRSFDGCSCAVRLEGIIGHDTVEGSEQGTLQAKVDITIDSVWHVMYPAGADIKHIKVTNSSSTFTNSGRVSNMPVSDNQGFGVL